jgi:tetratricopeptide (TPR) repeat protein
VALAAALAVYLNALPNAFVWDDLHLIVNNPAIKRWDRLAALFAADLFPPSVPSHYYRPLQALTYLVDYHLWGLTPAGYHLTSALLHGATAVLLYRLAHALTRDAPAALAAATLFAVHPIHTEAVTYVSGRSDPLSAPFLLAALLAFLRARGRPPGRWSALSAAAFLLALLAREAALGLVLLVPLVDAAVRHRDAEPPGSVPAWQRARRYLPYAGVLFLYLALRVSAVGTGAPPAATAAVSLPLRLLTMLEVTARYLGLLLVPVNQHMERVIAPAASPLAPAVLGSAVVVAGLVAVAVACRRRAWPVTFGLAWFGVALLPVSNVVPLATFMAEHWLYVPSMGLFVAAGWSLARLAARGWRRAAAATAAAAILVYGGATVHRNRDWRDAVAIYQATLAHAPHSVRALTNLGHAYQEAGRLDDAVAAYRRAMAVGGDRPVEAPGPAAGDPRGASAPVPGELADAHNNLGNVYRQQGRFEEAAGEFRAASAINPRLVAAYDNLGVTLEAMGRGEEARQAFEAALRVDPDAATVHSNLGNYYFRRGDLGRARAEYLTAIRLNPDYAEAHNNLGSVHVNEGRLDLAEQAYRTALQLNPSLEAVRRNLATVIERRREAATPGAPAPPPPR